MATDKQVKVNLVLEASQTLNNVERLGSLLKEISSVNIGNLNKQFSSLKGSTKEFLEIAKFSGIIQKGMNDIATSATKMASGFDNVNSASSKARQEMKGALDGYKTQINTLKSQTDAVLKSNKDISSLGDNMVKVSKAIYEVRKAMQEMSVTIKEGAWDRFLKNVDRGNPLFKEAETRIQALRKEVTALEQALGKVPTASQVAKQNPNSQPGFLQTPQVFETYTQQMKRLTKEADYWHQSMSKATNPAEIQKAQMNLQRVEQALGNVGTSSDALQKRIAGLNSSFFDLEYLTSKFKSHIMWIATGMVLDKALSIPTDMVQNLKAIEQGMAGMAQTIPDLHKNHELLNKTTHDFIGIAQQYGERIENIIEAGKLWSRGYKDIGMVEAFMHSSAVLAVADNFSMVEANKALEATMAQLGWRATNTAEAMAYSMRIVDSWTWVAHNAQVSANDLAQANERSASSARMVGVEFDFLQGMIASAVKNTGRSGAEVGNMLKSVFGSIHSKKAIEQIEALGVSVYQFGANGEKEFRKVEDVLLDLSLATQGTEKNLEEMFKAVAGGKFQWNKFASAMNYDDIVKGMALSVGSMGRASEQVGMQMDTITRKSEQLKASLQQTIASTGDAGLTSAIKITLDVINKMVSGMNNIPKGTYLAVAGLTAFAGIAYILKGTMDRMNTTVTLYNNLKAEMARRTLVSSGALEAEAIVANTQATPAMTRLGIATTFATGGLNVLLTVLGLVTAGIGLYSLGTTNANDAIQEHVNQSNKAIAVKEEEYEINNKQIKLLDSLEGKYFSLKEAQSQLSGDKVKADQITKNLTATEEALMSAMDKESRKIFEDSGFTREAFEAVRKAHQAKTVSIQNDLKRLQSEQKAYLENQIAWLETQVDVYMKDAEAYYKGVKWKISALDLWQTAQLKMYEWQTAHYEKQAQTARQTGDFWTAKGDTARAQQYYDMANQADTDAESSRQSGAGIVQSPLAKLDSELHQLKTELSGIYSGMAKGAEGLYQQDYTIGGNDAPEDKPGKVKVDPLDKQAPYGHAPIDYQAEAKRNEFKHEETALLDGLADAGRKWSAELDRLNTNEKIYGKTVEGTVEKFEAYKKHGEDLQTQLSDVSTFKEKMENELLDALGKDSEWQEIMKGLSQDWNNMTRKQRIDAYNDYHQLKQNMKDIEFFKTSIEKADRAISETKEKIAKNDTDIDQMKTGDKSWNTEYSRWKEQQALDKLNDLSQINKYSPLASMQRDLVDLKYMDAEAQKLRDHAEDLRKKLNDAGHSEADLSQYRSELAKTEKDAKELENQAKELKEKLDQNVKKGFADMFLDMAKNGRSFRDIWKSLWNDLAKDALYALLKIQNNAPGMLSQVFGLLGGIGGGTGALKAIPGKTQAPLSSIPVFHSGGDVTGGFTPVVPNIKGDETLAKLQVGEEVNSLHQRRTNEIMGAVAMKAIQAQNEKPTNIVIQAVDSRSFVDYLDAHGGALVSILRKQNALGNR